MELRTMPRTTERGGHIRGDRLLSPEQLSRAVGIPRKTLYKWVRTGRVPSLRIGRLLRFSENAIAEWLASSTKQN